MIDLEHNPRTKGQIKELLMKELYEPVLERQAKQLKDIIQTNCKITGTSHPSLIYRGNVYVVEGSAGSMPRQISTLAPALRPNMDDYLKETGYLNGYELPFVLGYINQVLNLSEDLPDYLHLLPSTLHKPILKLIATCPCRHSKLDQEQIDAFLAANAM